MNDKGLWDEEDGFFYDVLTADGTRAPVAARSMVGAAPAAAVTTLEPEDARPRCRDFGAAGVVHRTPTARRGASSSARPPRRTRLAAALDRRPRHGCAGPRADARRRTSSCPPTGCARCPTPSRAPVRHRSRRRRRRTVDYEPAESTTDLFGGNSNWRGPVWFPLNYLLVEALARLPLLLRRRLQVECPTGSGHGC